MGQVANIMLPKYRYDQVNQKYKEALERIDWLERKLAQKDEAISSLKAERQDQKRNYEELLLNLQVKETFVDGGILKEQYDVIIPKMTCRKEEKVALAKAIVQLIKDQRNLRKEVNEYGN